MAWLWWLLAPVASTLIGGLVLMVRSASEPESRRGRFRSNSIAEHQALLAALAQHVRERNPVDDLGEPVPSGVRVLDGDHSVSSPQ